MTRTLPVRAAARALLLAALVLPLAAGQAAPKAQGPVLLTSCGQSLGSVMLKALLTRAGVAFDLVPQATPADLKAKPYGSVMIVMGASLKGMGAAGISIDDEIRRATELIDAAKAAKVQVIGAHIEGMKRRSQGAAAGDTTDEQSIDAVAPRSDLLVVNKEGDSDGRFTAISKGKGIPMIVIERNPDLVAELAKLFAK